MISLLIVTVRRFWWTYSAIYLYFSVTTHSITQMPFDITLRNHKIFCQYNSAEQKGDKKPTSILQVPGYRLKTIKLHNTAFLKVLRRRRFNCQEMERGKGRE